MDLRNKSSMLVIININGLKLRIFPEAKTGQSQKPHAMGSEYIPANIKGHGQFSYGGDVIPENVSITEYYDLTSLKKSKLRQNDELVPKPTDIDVTEKVIKIPVPREHPYASHIPRCAVFPYSRSSDVTSNDSVALLKKTIGSSYRQEVLMKQTEPRVWPGQRGFYDQYPKPMSRLNHVFYPAPPKIICPNPSLSARETSLSTLNLQMRRSWEKSRYLTTYQRDYPGGGPQTFFGEKVKDITPGNGTPSIQKQLPPKVEVGTSFRPHDLQDSFSKSDILRDFYKSTNESTVDLRDNLRPGKRSYFQGLCSQHMRNRSAVPLPVG